MSIAVANGKWMRAGLPVLAGSLYLAACTEEPPPPRPVETEVPAELRRAPAPAQADSVAASAEGAGTPLAQRVATLGFLNKRNRLSQDIQLRPGEARRIGDVIVRLASCERTAPWELPRETGAFVQVFVQGNASGGTAAEWRQVFSGWLFKNSPSLNVVEHPIYDVWVKDCTMRFPGESASPANGSEAEGTSSPAASRPARRAAPAPASPAPEAEPAAAPTATPAPADAA